MGGYMSIKNRIKQTTINKKPNRDIFPEIIATVIGINLWLLLCALMPH